MIIKPTANILLKQDAGTDVNFDISAVDATDGGTGLPKGVEEQGALSTTAAALLTTPASGHTIQVSNLTVTNTGASTRTVTVYRPEDGSTVTAATTRDILTLLANETAEWTPGGWVQYDANHRLLGSTLAAVQADQETSTSLTTFVSPGTQHFHPSAAKCWGNTTGAGSPVIGPSYNTTSITDTAVGRLTVTIATDFSAATWTGVCCTTNATNSNRMCDLVTKAAGSVILESASATTTLADPGTGWEWAFYGDL